MTSSRLEAFSDGVVAILITIMVLELRPPHGTDWRDLLPLAPHALTYLLSFVFLGIYWNNHHHMLHLARRVDGRVLWANLHLLFWLSLVPFVTGWMGENHAAPVPTAAYGAVLLAAAIAYAVLQRELLRCQGDGSELAAAVGRRGKEYASTALYLASLPLAFVHPLLSIAIYVAVAALWLVPDRRIEARMRG